MTPIKKLPYLAFPFVSCSCGHSKNDEWEAKKYTKDFILFIYFFYEEGLFGIAWVPSSLVKSTLLS